MAGSADYGLLDTAVPYKAALAPIQGATYVNQLAAQQLQNQASNFEMQNALAEQAAYQRGGDIAQNLRAGGLGKQALEYEAKQSALDNASLERAGAKIKVARGLITDATTPDQFKLIMGGTYKDKDVGPLYAGMGMSADKMHQMVDEAAADPNKWNSFLRQAAMGMDAAEQHTIQMLNAQAAERNSMRGSDSLAIQERKADIAERRLGMMEENQRLTAERNTPEYIASKEQAKQEAKQRVELTQKLPGAIEMAKQSLSTIDSMIGKRDPKTGELLQGQAAHPGFESYVGATLVPGAKYIPGSDTASFESYQKQLSGEAMLQAYNTLRGTGAIATKEGEQATAAMLRANSAQSEKDYIKAMLEFRSHAEKAISEAENYLKAPAPTAAPAAAPRASGGGSNPWKGGFEAYKASKARQQGATQ